jgi:transketolase
MTTVLPDLDSTAVSGELDNLAINTIRMLAVDQVAAAGSGHYGFPLGASPMLHTLFHRHIVSDPANPEWVNRDRFVLSAGHGSAMLYGTLHLAGFDLSIADLRDFRQLGSRTPGHPEREVTAGVDATTGPLGQGVANAVGMAMAETMLAAQHNKDGRELINHRTFAVVSDGDLMEGIATEAMALAGRLQLGKLVLLYDDNDVVIDGRATQVHDAAAVCQAAAAYGWHVTGPINGESPEAIDAAIRESLARTDAPSLIRVKTVIGFGSRLADDPSSHSGAPSADDVATIRENLAWPESDPFHVPDIVRQHWQAFRDRGRAAFEDWQAAARATPGAEITSGGELVIDAKSAIRALADVPAASEPEAVRASSGAVMDIVARHLPVLVGGSGDLAAATFAVVPESPVYGPKTRAGRNIAFGVREHAMGAICNGIALHGGLVPFASTFLVFASYEANALRMAALQGLQVIHVLTHDSISVGEDGPTHQPIESLPMLRATPNTLVLRPADRKEAEAAWELALLNTTGPTALVLSRMPVPQLDHSEQFGDASRGGYALQPRLDADIILAATGSEVSLCVEAATLIRAQGYEVQIVSIPSLETFAEQPEDYRSQILPAGIPRLVVEASHPQPWGRIAGDSGDIIGITTFGASGKPAELLKHFGFTPDAVASRALALLAPLNRTEGA